MKRNLTNLSFAVLAAGSFLLPGSVRAADDPPAHQHMAHFQECAKACASCMRECEACARHCAGQIVLGKKEHALTLGTCSDCGDICATAAKITARGGPVSATVCEACAKVCDTCAAACEKFPNDDHMKQCAKECRDCAKACREMLKHVGHAPQEK